MNQANSPLLLLPPELRDIIYESLLRIERLEVIVIAKRDRAGLKQHPLALLRSCSQIHAGTAMLPYTLNVFTMQGYIGYFNSWKLLDHIGQKQLQAIKRMQLKTCRGSIVLGIENNLARFKRLEFIEVWDGHGRWNEDLIRRIHMRLPGVVISKSKAVRWKPRRGGGETT